METRSCYHSERISWIPQCSRGGRKSFFQPVEQGVGVPAIVCQNCGRANQPDRRFCVDCGARLEPRCAVCGAAIEPVDRFCGQCGERLEDAPHWPNTSATSNPSLITNADSPAGERRQISVLFADLVGSTELTMRLDPEEYHEIVQSYHQAVSRVMGRFNGYVAQYQGDGVVVYFGWPRALGDDAERAVRSGLELIDAVKALNRDLPERKRIRVRAGIDTGPVMVGHMGRGGRREPTALGETPNIAARAQATAPEDGLVITGATNRLVGGFFVVEPLGPQRFKGVAAAVEVFRVVRVTGVRSRLHAGQTLTPFVGREAELRTLEQWYDLAERGAGRVVLIDGEPGIGKSRLVRQFHEILRARRHTWLESFCSPFETNKPFAPVVTLLAESFVSSGRDSVEERLESLAIGLAGAGFKVEEALPLIAEMLDLPLPAHYPPLVSPPEQKRRRLIATLAQWVFALAGMQPLVMVLEDAQWADPSTLEFHRTLVERSAAAPLMLIYTARPDFTPPWPAVDHHARIAVGRLDGRETREMARAAARGPFDNRAIELVAARTDGVPLFVEELARVMAERGGADNDRAEEVPATLADSLMARIDRLGEAKDVAQIASVIGREFSYGVLREIAGRDDAALSDALVRIADAELISADSDGPRANYLFKHGLVRDAAYNSLLRSRRRELHRTIARSLREKFPRLAESEPETLAYHLTEAGETASAVAAWRDAGDRSAGRGALAEASIYYSRGIEVLFTMPPSLERDQRELALRIALGSIYTATKGLASREVEEVYQRARELGERVGGGKNSILLGLWQTYLGRGELAAAQALAERRLEIARREGAPLSLCWSHYALGATLMHRGRLAEAIAHLRLAVQHCGDRDSTERLLDAGPLAMSYLSVALMLSGRADEARAIGDRALKTAGQTGKPFNLAFSSVNVAATYQLANDFERVFTIAHDAAQFAHARHLVQFASGLDVYAGWALAMRGDAAAGIERLHHGIAGWIANGQRLPYGWYLALMAWACALGGRLDEARQAIQDAHAAVGELLMDRPTVAWAEAEILRLSGADSAALERAHGVVIREARATGNRIFELRAATALARRLADRGEAAAARALLAEQYRDFAAGGKTPDVLAAGALLDSLSA